MQSKFKSKHSKLTSASWKFDGSQNRFVLLQSNLDYPDYSIIQTFFSGPNFFMNIN